MCLCRRDGPILEQGMRYFVCSCAILFGLTAIITGVTFIGDYDNLVAKTLIDEPIIPNNLLEEAVARTLIDGHIIPNNLLEREVGFVSIGLGGFCIIAGLNYLRSQTPTS